MLNYDDKCHIIESNLDNKKYWLWPKEDRDLWGHCSNEWPMLKQMWEQFIDKYDVCIQAGGA